MLPQQIRMNGFKNTAAKVRDFIIYSENIWYFVLIEVVLWVNLRPPVNLILKLKHFQSSNKLIFCQNLILWVKITNRSNVSKLKWLKCAWVVLYIQDSAEFLCLKQRTDAADFSILPRLVALSIQVLLSFKHMIPIVQ